jgi:hypothetical protein
MSTANDKLGFELVDPWVDLRDDGAALVAELKKELRDDCDLYGLEFKAIAHRCDCDDVLFRIEGRSEKFAVVHLTWSGKTDQNKGFPWTVLYVDAEDWRTKCMIPDQEDYTA